MGALLEATASALRVPVSDVLARPLGKRLVVQAGYAVGLPNARRLAADLGCSERTVHRVRVPRHPGLDAVLTCLGDPRLLGDIGEASRAA